MSRLSIKARHEPFVDRSVTTIEISGLARFEPDRITYETIGPDAPELAPNGNFAIAAVLPTAMARGGELHFEGAVDSDYLRTIEECMAAWCRWRPDLFQPVTLTADTETPPSLPERHDAIMAFSGGLDSTFALHAHKHNLLGRRRLDVKSAVLVQGFDIAFEDDHALETARGHAKALLDSYGVRLNVVKTNWQKPFCVKWGMTHVLGISAILHLFHRQFGCALFADDTPYEHQLTPWSSNAITNQMLGCTRYPIRTTGASWDRTEKARIVASNPVVLEHLRVCYERPELGENCGSCEKCIRTKLNFYAAGVDFVPALMTPVTAEDVRTKCTLNPRIVHLYVDTLEHGTWRPGDPVRTEVEALVSRYTGEVATTTGLSSRRKPNGLRRVAKKVRPALRRLRNALSTFSARRRPPER